MQPSKDGTDSFTVPRDLPQQTQEWTRNTKMLKPKLSEYEERLIALNRTAAGVGAFRLEDVVHQEAELSNLRTQLAQLRGEIKAYEGLPPDKNAAREEVKRLEREVEGLKRERDRIFADMVRE